MICKSMNSDILDIVLGILFYNLNVFNFLKVIILLYMYMYM